MDSIKASIHLLSKPPPPSQLCKVTDDWRAGGAVLKFETLEGAYVFAGRLGLRRG